MSFINYLINGVSLGSVYAIIALGYTMVYGIAKMLNFAHGDIIMIGSYVVFVTVSSMGLPPVLGVLLAVAACTLLGVVIERVAYKPLRSAADLWRGYKIIYFCCKDPGIKAGRRPVKYYRRDHCNHSFLYRDHGMPDGIY